MSAADQQRERHALLKEKTKGDRQNGAKRQKNRIASSFSASDDAAPFDADRPQKLEKPAEENIDIAALSLNKGGETTAKKKTEKGAEVVKGGGEKGGEKEKEEKDDASSSVGQAQPGQENKRSRKR
jgi:hypothetical protein